jgi:hypothetical protein
VYVARVTFAHLPHSLHVPSCGCCVRAVAVVVGTDPITPQPGGITSRCPDGSYAIQCEPTPPSSDSGLSGGIIALIIILIVLAVGALVYWWCWRNRKTPAKAKSIPADPTTSPSRLVRAPFRLSVCALSPPSSLSLNSRPLILSSHYASL